MEIDGEGAKEYRKWLLTNCTIYLCAFFILFEMRSVPGTVATGATFLLMYSCDSAIARDGYCRSAWSRLTSFEMEGEEVEAF